jgi:hypothetical protein
VVAVAVAPEQVSQSLPWRRHPRTPGKIGDDGRASSAGQPELTVLFPFDPKAAEQGNSESGNTAVSRHKSAIVFPLQSYDEILM